MTQMGLTRRQREALNFINRFIAEHGGVSPSRREIADGLGMKSSAQAHYILARLKERGHVDWQPGRARALTVLEAA